MMERLSIWISFGIALVLVVAIVQLHPAKQSRTVRDVNALMVIAPYKYQGAWVFDDPATGLVREPFIAGIDTMIDNAVSKIPNAEKGFREIGRASCRERVK